MDSLPIEILLAIGSINFKIYRGMLAIPRYARAISIGYRLDRITGVYNYELKLHSISLYNRNGLKRQMTIANFGRLTVEQGICVYDLSRHGTIRSYNDGHVRLHKNGIVVESHNNGDRYYTMPREIHVGLRGNYTPRF